jgi:hypothetical protein
MPWEIMVSPSWSSYSYTAPASHEYGRAAKRMARLLPFDEASTPILWAAGNEMGKQTKVNRAICSSRNVKDTSCFIKCNQELFGLLGYYSYFAVALKPQSR